MEREQLEMSSNPGKRLSSVVMMGLRRKEQVSEIAVNLTGASRDWLDVESGRQR